MPTRLKVAVLGATGYSGLELTRILLRHPQVEKPVLLKRSADSGIGATNLADIFPALSGNGGYPLQSLSWQSLKKQGVELLFLATPHEVSRALVPEAVEQGIRVIDLSGAWRLKQEQHRAIYGFKDEDSVTAADLTEKAVYGLPELHSDKIPNAMVIANPGCYATTVILGLAPLLLAGLADRDKGIIADIAHAFRFRCRQSLGLRRIHASPSRRNCRTVAFEHERNHVHAASAADTARNSIDDLRTA